VIGFAASWIVLAVAAAAIQTVRSVIQKEMAARLSVLGSTYARFLYGLPLAIVFLAAGTQLTGRTLPDPTAVFFGYVVLGALGQVVGNVLFIRLISHANFTISATYVKTETVLAAGISFVVLGDVLSPAGVFGVVITVIGCMVLAAGRDRVGIAALARGLGGRAAIQGLSAGASYAVASTCYRAATLSLGADAPEFNAIYCLAWVSVIQTVGLGLFLGARNPSALREVVRSWRASAWIGITGVTASACWYAAFALQATAYVLAVGQVEVVFAYLVSRFRVRERASVAEGVGILVTVAGILCVAIAG
jgi:drug/metabolite transporter (DMT)-like permease